MENVEVILPIEKYDEMMKAVAVLEIAKRLLSKGRLSEAFLVISAAKEDKKC